MHSLKSIRFQKFDQYQNPVFIASSNKADEKEMYDLLKSYSDKLENQTYGTFLPIYSNEAYRYATIRFKKSQKYNKMTHGDRYDIEYSIKKKVKPEDGKTYINCYLNKMKLVSKAPKPDWGEDVEF